MSEGTAGDGFAALLRELKDRSGLSYGVLAKRLHMSTSTLHRYCNGDAVPTDYAPVERLARLCKASPGELVELHRRWVLADAGRGQRKGTEEASAPAAEVPAEELPPLNAESADPGPSDDGPAQPSRPRRTAVLAATAAAAVLAGVAFAVNPLSDDGSRHSDDAGRTPVGAATSSGAPPTKAAPSTSPTKDAKETTPPASPSANRTSSGAVGSEQDATEPLLTVNTRPYTWEGPCSQHYLIDEEPGKVTPPPFQQDAPAWVAALGAVSAKEQLVTVTVQGTGEETVVLDSLTVKVVSKDTPLAWNDYTMGVGCGGDVPVRPFTVALDAARPVVVAAAGQRNLPFKVSESEPEVFRITADASAYDVRWYLELAWSSGTRHDKVVIDDGGKPFRTSGNNGRPRYEFPLGGEKWIPSSGEGS
ncbi:helix-turn-helix domain-containing protein [Streptomyces sp. NBC_00287]|uniref:helix-turn-helix domain-containing protein n=1 Tax=Streptomyces sp. NBC_00287 TaxID=2975702 RepID=UPI002E2B87E2|nr:helix-turn-helix domain-containing protein [Streptomyces sp. NBC_00287]